MNDKKHNRLFSRSLMTGSLITWALVSMLVLLNAPAFAWERNKKDEPKQEPTRAVNLDKHPPMEVYRGVLRQDNFGGWLLDKKLLSFSRNSRITDTPDSRGGTTLVEGRQARVTAANVGGTLIVYRVTMLSMNEMMDRGHYNVGSIREGPELGEESTPR